MRNLGLRAWFIAAFRVLGGCLCHLFGWSERRCLGSSIQEVVFAMLLAA